MRSTKPHWSRDEERLRGLLEAGKTVVLNCRKRGPQAHLVAWAETRGLAVYIGRESGWAKPSRQRSMWANPFKPGIHGTRDEVCTMYREYLLGRRDTPQRWRTPRPSVEQLEELQGRALLCWCAPLACHGDILVALLTRQRT